MKHVLGSGLSRGLAVILCFLLLVDQGLCWGAGGHMIVAQIAYARLNSRAKAEVDKLIGLRIEPAAITEKSLDFVNASHWPDDLRPDKAFANTLPLHFVNFPFTPDHTKLPAELPEAENIITALNKYVDVLKSSSDDQQRAQALRFIIHFVGDIHQPLHCASRVSADLPKGDKGGNDFPIVLKGQTVKLHSYWDGGIGDFPKTGPNFAPPPLDQIPPAVKRIIAEFPKDNDDFHWKAGGPFDFAGWAHEGLELAEDVAYKDITPNSQPSEKYNKAAIKTVHRRVLWGGYRLAELLNTIWPEQ